MAAHRAPSMFTLDRAGWELVARLDDAGRLLAQDVYHDGLPAGVLLYSQQIWRVRPGGGGRTPWLPATFASEREALRALMRARGHFDPP